MPSSSIQRILLTDIKAMPWKNGGGVTREIATGAAPGAGQDWGWRFSIADVERDGPFSVFPKTDRVIAVIEGEGMDLLGPDGGFTKLEPFQAVSISGDNPLLGRLRDGPVRDLNIMTLRDHFEATLDIWQGPRCAALENGKLSCLLIHNLSGGCTLRAGGKTHVLAAAETLVHEGQDSFDLHLPENSRSAVISIEPRTKA